MFKPGEQVFVTESTCSSLFPLGAQKIFSYLGSVSLNVLIIAYDKF